MQLNISPENARLIDSLVASGEYANREAVIDQALRLLRKHEALRQAIAEGMEGEAIPGDVVFEYLERRVGLR